MVRVPPVPTLEEALPGSFSSPPSWFRAVARILFVCVYGPGAYRSFASGGARAGSVLWLAPVGLATQTSRPERALLAQSTRQGRAVWLLPAQSLPAPQLLL